MPKLPSPLILWFHSYAHSFFNNCILTNLKKYMFGTRALKTFHHTKVSQLTTNFNSCHGRFDLLAFTFNPYYSKLGLANFLPMFDLNFQMLQASQLGLPTIKGGKGSMDKNILKIFFLITFNKFHYKNFHFSMQLLIMFIYLYS